MVLHRYSLVVLVGIGGAVLGCATDGHVYRESVSQTKSDAPASLNPPSDEGNNYVDPNYMRTQADFHFSIADAMSMEGNGERAIEEFKLALIYDPNSATVHLRLAAEYIRKGMFSEALTETQTVVQLEPKRVDAHLLLGGLYSAIKVYDKSAAEYNKVIALDPDNTDAPVFLGALLAEQHHFDEAIAHFRRLAEKPNNKNPHLAYFYMGRLYQELEGEANQTAAEKAFEKSIEKNPAYAEANLALAEVYLKKSQRPRAISTLRHFQDHHGPNGPVAEVLGRLYLEDEKYPEAYQQFEIEEAADEDNLNVKVKLALILIEQRQYQNASTKLEEILAKAPSSDKIRFYLGAVYEELKRYRDAINQFNQIPSDSSFFSEAVVHAAYLNKVQNQYPTAIATVKRAIEIKPDVPQFYALYASFLDDLKDYSQGVSLLEGAVHRFPDNAQLHFFLGSMYDHVRKTPQAIDEMKKTLAVDGQYVQALNYLAYLYADHGLELAEAERLSRKALEIQPNDGYIMDTLGWVLLKQGRTAEAVQVLEVAYQRQPRESIIAEHLGDAYYRSELPEKARTMYQKAEEIETDSTNKQKLQGKINSLASQKVSADSP